MILAREKNNVDETNRRGLAVLDLWPAAVRIFGTQVTEAMRKAFFAHYSPCVLSRAVPFRIPIFDPCTSRFW